VTADESDRDLVRYDVGDGVCTLILDNPERHNAWNPVMERQHFEALDRAAFVEKRRPTFEQLPAGFELPPLPPFAPQ
jgi:hypothetical protein